ncbi:MAG: CopG family transcriptional regulator [Acidobacteria bacterium]|nr:MAG: CopG family transcriptional regulator [Acidobacteriota bacterium]
MRETITISLPEDIKKELDAASRSEAVTRSDIVRESLRNYLFVRRFRALRARMMARAQGQGIRTDDDVFDRVS